MFKRLLSWLSRGKEARAREAVEQEIAERQSNANSEAWNAYGSARGVMRLPPGTKLFTKKV